jgi:hypothetical protein
MRLENRPRRLKHHERKIKFHLECRDFSTPARCLPAYLAMTLLQPSRRPGPFCDSLLRPKHLPLTKCGTAMNI